ncbi:L-ascorbate metabolism protein UlaG (beta-lactamase superfamily) [Paenibacillus baekrokdamisoli]|uniref:MBL fold metallo-hydrolase n=1 Tax=Paenibacillus baekrokdamisoli TaxID=1712516 RepID=UPI0017FF9EA7|nr:MBL fold metallo-hydrolase [Paenibacillus baekrokdamisoli]MBB3068811.1 L-ascorbate metabolism protein UlaG (beta-lactamase superfamily) [Paenibacillus baekrokdamisoli]
MIIVVLIIGVYLFMKSYPAFGGRPSREQRSRIEQSKSFIKGKFVNQIPTSTASSPKETVKILLEFMKGNPSRKPAKAIAAEPLNSQELFKVEAGKPAAVTWFGHSTLLLQLNGKTLFIDPMLGRAPSPFPAIGGKRYSSNLPIEIEDLPPIDAVLISHDHYDHLDYGSIKKLKGKVRKFFVPLGVGAHLERWGVDPNRIEEHDWWDEFEFEGLTLASTPARHFSGRSLTDRNTTLWCSWVILSPDTKIFFSGDSGYGPHFTAIGDKYGPFDLTLMECGQYDERWATIHMMPEETVQAHLDVKGKVMIPIHWGAFTLALHSWIDPAERAVKAARAQNVSISTPRIGEKVLVGTARFPASAWWQSYE